MWSIHAVGLYPALQRKVLIPATTWMKLEDIMLSNLSQKDKNCLIPHM